MNQNPADRLRALFPTTKCCAVCQQTKPTTEFYKHPSSADGLLPSCTLCKRESVKLNYYQRRQHQLARA